MYEEGERMFLDKIKKTNIELLKTAVELHQAGKLLPDTYVIDLDSFMNNATNLLEEAKRQNIHLYFMLKQVGRNPYIAKKLIELGYEGAVVVDFKEASIMMKHGIPIANVGHLVQPPRMMLQELVDYGCTYFTVFSYDKIKDINACAEKKGIVQKLMLKVVGPQDMIYSGQTAGFHLEELPELIENVKQLKHVKISGVTSFPCFLYNEETKKTNPTPNLNTLFKAKQLLKEYGIEIENVNAPSSTSLETLKQMKKYAIDSGEPGHGLSGTTPYHAQNDGCEVPCVVYVSEISHNFNGTSYCYGGGYYRRSHVSKALVGSDIHHMRELSVLLPNMESIDYYFGLNEPCHVNETVLMAFRFQIFVTRSNVCLIEGIHHHHAHIVGLYTSQGEQL